MLRPLTSGHAPADPPREALPIAIIGGGPIGLVAAAHLVSRGEVPLVLEAGSRVGESIRDWAHVQLFSPWKYLTDPVARGLLQEAGWTPPADDALPTGGELVERFLEPLAALPDLAPHLRLGRRVTRVSRVGYDKVKTSGREDAPFALFTHAPDGRTERFLARAVIDASGTFTSPNPLGASGLPVEGEEEPRLRSRIRYGIPDVLGRERSRYAGKRTLVVGSGHSAFNAVLDLARLAGEAPGTETVWAIRRSDPGRMFGGGGADALAARGRLGERIRRHVDAGDVTFVTGFRAAHLVETTGGIEVESEDGRTVGPVDEIVVTTGFRPDLEMLRELRVDLDPWLEAPVALAPLIDPNVHSCGTVYPHGYAELKHPERDFFVVGMKSYGRAPTFLLLTGYEQVRSVVCGLTGDLEGARKVELELPGTGVCSTDAPGAPAVPVGSETLPDPASVSPAHSLAPAAAPAGPGDSGSPSAPEEAAPCCGPACCG